MNLEVSSEMIGINGELVNLPSKFKPLPNQLQGSPSDNLAEFAGRICYDSLGKRGRDSASYHKHILEVGHLSIYRHCQTTVHIDTDFSHVAHYFPFASVVPTKDGLFGEACRVTFDARQVISGHIEHGPPTENEDRNKLWDIMYECFRSRNPLVYAANKKGFEFGYPKNGDTFYVPEPKYDNEIWISFLITCSRGCSHELVRHGAYTGISQRSTRYCDESSSGYVAHPFLLEPQNKDLLKIFEDHMMESKGVYQYISSELTRRLSEQGYSKGYAHKQARGAARGALGNATATELVFSASLAQWKHIINMRGIKDGMKESPADKEIEVLAMKIKEQIESRFGKLELHT